MDDIYQVYVNRIARMTLPEAYQSQVQYIQASPKFQQQPEGTFEAIPFPGYSVITPPWSDDPANSDLYGNLQTFQSQICKTLAPGLVTPVPPESFHMTLADLIWDSAYRHALETPGFEDQLRDRIAESFRRCQAEVKSTEKICWQVLGLIVMTRAIAVCLAPRNERSYERVISLRRAIYQNPELMALGVEQQYHLTAHITLGYFTDVSVVTKPEDLVAQLDQINETWLTLNAPQELWIHRAELRKFEDMTDYVRESDWPILEF